MEKKKSKGWLAGLGTFAGKKNLKWVLICEAAVLLVLVIVLICLLTGEKPVEPTDPTDSTPAVESTAAPTGTTAPSTEPTEEPTTIPPETEPVILEEYRELHEEYPDFVGWLKIPGTVIDYPVMYSPDDGDKYLYANMKGYFDVNGSLFIGDQCTMDPESDNLIIYGHNMMSGAMFGNLMLYIHEYYWKEHPIIEFSTLYEHREYEVVATFYDRLYYKTEDCFKFYQFTEAQDEPHFVEAMDYYKSHAIYDTGVEPEFGDRLITLVTCAYHVKNGRFVVVAREIPKD